MAIMVGIPVEKLQRVYAAVDYLRELEGQDLGYLVDMSQEMLNDLIESGDLKPMLIYVRRYCDVIDGPDDATRIAADI
jgi:hypothetical protein